jgi:C1A family cysteine protease
MIVAMSAIEYVPLVPAEPREYSEAVGQVDAQMLLEPFMSKDTKTLFKAWHFIFHKNYDYNNVEGIKKYQTFKQNLRAMNEHNAKNLSWSMGLNFLSDMTEAEINEYYHIDSNNFEDFKNNLRTMPNNIEGLTSPVKKTLGARPIVDYKAKMRAVRNQGNCGSCWAFATQALLEGSYQAWQTDVQDSFSTQQSVDCDTGNKGCNGGFYIASLNFFKKNTIVYEGGYPYTGAKGVCKYTVGMKGDTGIKISGYSYYMKGAKADVYDNLMKKGPVAIGVGVANDFFRYKTGIFDGKCAANNHAVVVVGYACAAGETGKGEVCYYVIRNSWGPTWGESGHIRIKDNGTLKTSCGVEEVAFGVNSFIKGP